MTKTTLITMGLLLLAGPCLIPGPGVAADLPLTIIYSADERGEINPCG